MIKKNITEKVLKFYRFLPFNFYSTLDLAAEEIKKNNPIKFYPPLAKIIRNEFDFKVIDVGCGAGWFTNSVSFHNEKVNSHGIDINKKALDFAKGISKKLNLKSTFSEENILKFKSNKKFQLVSSLGVLHHTQNFKVALKNTSLLSSEYFLVGLYHKYGRKPFLNYFKTLREKYYKLSKEDLEKKLFFYYKKLDNRKVDEIHKLSWFRDQVLHPHETQHSFEEINQILKNDFQLVFTSINRFEKIKNINEIVKEEKKLFDIGVDRLKEQQYYPGFFICIFKKK